MTEISIQVSPSKILIIDDEKLNLRLLTNICEELGHEVVTAVNGKDGIEKAMLEMPDLILMDAMMPEMDGFEATEKLKTHHQTKQIPLIMVTALDSREDRIRGIEMGANDFIAKPVDLKELCLRMQNNLEIKKYHDLLKDQNKVLEERVMERTQDLEEAYEKNKKSYIEAIFRLSLAAEYKDEDTGAHISRISLYSKELAFALGMSREFSETLFYASPMHDIGKVAIPDSILLKPGKLTNEEFLIMQSHSTIGAKILSGSESHFLKMAEEIALTHHERWSGTGYPDRLKGEEIPISGRITNIVDQYDALRSERPYKLAFNHKKTLSIIIEGDGRTSPEDFDPQVLETFKKMTGKMEEIFETEND